MYIGRILIAAAISAFGADSAGVTGPVSGVVFDARSQSIRLVTGFPGASLLADTLASQIDGAEIAPNGAAALVTKSGQLFAVSGLRGASPVWTPLLSTSQGIDRIVWSGDSSAAAVYSAAASSVTLVTNISNSGAAQITLSTASLPGNITALALPQAASSVVAGVAGGVYLLTPQNPPVLLAPAAQPAAVSLIHQDQDLLFVDAGSLQISELTDYQGSAQLIPFANLPAGATAPVAIAASADARFVYAADTACACVGVWDFATRALTSQIAVETGPAFLKPLAGGRLFLLNSPADNSTPFWILNTTDTPAAYFVSGGM